MDRERKRQDGSMVVTESRQYRDLVSRIKTMWQREQTPDAVRFLAEHSHIRHNRTLALELAYEEYCIRRENGEEMDRSLFCRRFPSISRSLYRQIEVDEYLRQHPELVVPQAGIDWPRRGDRLFGFLVEEEIGRGAFARAYLCSQTGIGNRHVVVKVAQGGAVEADTMGTLDHPNIMSVYSVQEDGASGLTGICMPFVGRSTLHDVIDVAYSGSQRPRHASVILEASRGLGTRLDRYHQLMPRVRLGGRSPFETGVLQIGLQIAEALAHAHSRGVLHGDLKPSNIVMSMDAIPVIVDFNLAMSQESHNLVTGGTLPYMAPEQIRAVLLGSDDQDRIDHRADVFALGAILYELLTGSVPYPLDGQEDDPVILAGWMLDVQRAGRPHWPNGLQVSPAMRDLILRCLAFSADDRPFDMNAVATELRQMLTWRRRTQRYLKQNRGTFWSLASAVVLSVGLTAGYLSIRPPAHERLYAKGVKQYEAGQYQAAIDYFGKAISSGGTDPLLFVGRACAAIRLFENDNYEGWLSAANRDILASLRSQWNADVVKLNAYCYAKRGEIAPALDSYEELLKEPDNWDAELLANLAYCLEKRTPSAFSQQALTERKQLDSRAQKIIRKAIELDGQAWQAHLTLAILELRLNRSSSGAHIPRDGLVSIRKVIDLRPPDASALVLASKLSGLVGIADQNDSLINECFEYAKSAIEKGYSFDSADIENLSPYSKLSNDPRLEKVLMVSPATSYNEVPMDRMIVPRLLVGLPNPKTMR